MQTVELSPIMAKRDALLDSEKTAKQIATTRKALKIQQKNLSSEMGISQCYLSDLENGNRRWSLDLFNRAKAAMEKLMKIKL